MLVILVQTKRDYIFTCKIVSNRCQNMHVYRIEIYMKKQKYQKQK